LAFDTAVNIQKGDWDAVAFDAGTLAGGALFGGGRGRWLAETLNGIKSPPWSLASDFAQRYNPNFPGGSLGKWWGSGFNPGSAGGTCAFTGSGIASLLDN
jgi:hypothetical protein